jgi:16S rRNA (adenine1518-N6/adenine1519-N6)-dimethyltransferase
MGPTPKRRYGQHFLRDTGILRRIVGFIAPEPGDLIVEVGGGDGALSTLLAPQVLRLFSIEIDRDLVPDLAQALAPFPNARAISQDILQADLRALVSPVLAPGVCLRIVGNLPYNIGTAIIEKMLAAHLPIRDLTLMLQLETAERICAKPGTKEYGFFSVFCQHYCEVRMGFKIAPACFVPRPKVISAVLMLQPKNYQKIANLEENFLAVAKAAFAHRRKKLANSLRCDGRLGPVSGQMLKHADIDGSRRPEDLSVTEYECLARTYLELRPDLMNSTE